MIILDTNVVSEALRPSPDPIVVSWLAGQDRSGLLVTAPGWAELLTGIAMLPAGRKKQRLAEHLRHFQSEFVTAILPFDRDAAVAYAGLIARARSGGRAIAVMDGQIAAIALSRRAVVATRDTAPFEAAGVAVINPWLSA